MVKRHLSLSHLDRKHISLQRANKQRVPVAADGTHRTRSLHSPFFRTVICDVRDHFTVLGAGQQKLIPKIRFGGGPLEIGFELPPDLTQGFIHGQQYFSSSLSLAHDDILTQKNKNVIWRKGLATDGNSFCCMAGRYFTAILWSSIEGVVGCAKINAFLVSHHRSRNAGADFACPKQFTVFFDRA